MFPGGPSTGYKEQVFTTLAEIYAKNSSLHLNFMTTASIQLLTGTLVPRIVPSSSQLATLPWASGQAYNKLEVCNTAENTETEEGWSLALPLLDQILNIPGSPFPSSYREQSYSVLSYGVAMKMKYNNASESSERNKELYKNIGNTDLQVRGQPQRIKAPAVSSLLIAI